MTKPAMRKLGDGLILFFLISFSYIRYVPDPQLLLAFYDLIIAIFCVLSMSVFTIWMMVAVWTHDVVKIRWLWFVFLFVLSGMAALLFYFWKLRPSLVDPEENQTQTS